MFFEEEIEHGRMLGSPVPQAKGIKRKPTTTRQETDKKKKRNEKLIKTVTACPHVDSKHYAKNLCSNCYHRKGRDKKAWACKHVDRIHYAHGLCHNCYQTSHIEKVKQNNIVGD